MDVRGSKGDSIGDLGNKNEPAADRLESKSRKQRAGDVGRAFGVAGDFFGRGGHGLLGPDGLGLALHRLQRGSGVRDQPHGTYKLLFNGLYYGSAKGAILP